MSSNWRCRKISSFGTLALARAIVPDIPAGIDTGYFVVADATGTRVVATVADHYPNAGDTD